MPTWFREAIAAPSTDFDCDSLGTRIRYRGWNPQASSLPPLLLCHGYRAHTHWWDCIAPFFTARYRVYALDFAGMGDSAERPTYSARLFAQDILAVIADAGLVSTTLVGHSFGGGRVLEVALEHPQLLRRVLILDSYLHFEDDAPPPLGPDKVGRPTPYPTREAILSRYRLMPEQPTEPYIRDYVARHSIREVDGGWRWKFDAALATLPMQVDMGSSLQRVSVPIDFIYGSESQLVPPARAARIGAALPPPGTREAIRLPNAHHHMMLDQPLLLIDTLQRLLA